MFFVIPIGHDKGIFRVPTVTLAVIVLCLGVQVFMSLQPEPPPPQPIDLMRQALGLEPTDADWARMERHDMFLRFGFVPARARVFSWISYAFFHGGWMHLIGNMLFLWLCGCNLEDRWGRAAFGGFYLFGAVAGAFGFFALHPNDFQPMVGASGAIAALMGAFLVLFYNARIRFAWLVFLLFLFRWGTFSLPAWVALPFWFGQQALGTWMESVASVGMAFSAHVGGFVLGAGVALTLRLTGVDRWLAKRIDDSAPAEFKEDERFVRAMDMGLAGRPEEKCWLLEELLRDKPTHEGAQKELCLLALERGDYASAFGTLDRVLLAMMRRGEILDAADLWRKVTQEGLPAPPDRAYLAASRVLEAVREPREALTALTLLLKHHPQTAFLPRVLLEAARIQADGLYDRSAARKTLEVLLARVPQGPFADQARARLAQLPVKNSVVAVD